MVFLGYQIEFIDFPGKTYSDYRILNKPSEKKYPTKTFERFWFKPISTKFTEGNPKSMVPRGILTLLKVKKQTFPLSKDLYLSEIRYWLPSLNLWKLFYFFSHGHIYGRDQPRYSAYQSFGGSERINLLTFLYYCSVVDTSINLLFPSFSFTTSIWELL